MNEKGSLLILWTSSDREVALKTIFMYAENSLLNDWWDHVEVCIWGPSALLAVRDEEIRVRLSLLDQRGVRLSACKSCSDEYGISEDLIEMGIDVKYTGVLLTDALRSDKKIITF